MPYYVVEIIKRIALERADHLLHQRQEAYLVCGFLALGALLYFAILGWRLPIDKRTYDNLE